MRKAMPNKKPKPKAKTLSLPKANQKIPKPTPDDMATIVEKPKSMSRPKVWSHLVEENYRFQLAGYRDELEYRNIQSGSEIDRWPHNGWVKKLQRRDGCFYYYNKARECSDKDVHRTKMYIY